MRFVTDFLWRSPLGLRINAQDTAGVTQTEDWVKIRGDQLVPRNGAYDVRITAELWETHFFDHVSLMAVDHPDDVEVFVDERFSSQPPALAVHAMTPPRAGRARLGRSGPRRDGPRERTGRPLPGHLRARAVPGHRRGSLRRVRAWRGDRAETDRCGWSRTAGSIRPTAASTWRSDRVSTPRRAGCRSKRRTRRAAGVVVAPDLGFPAGKNKTILIDLQPGRRGARRLRLRTNLEVYWDWLAHCRRRRERALVTTRLQPARAELRYRGFSRTSHERRDQPEVPAVRRDRERRPALARSRSATTRASATCASCSTAWTTATSS